MRVCLISREYPPDTGWGGIGTFTHHLAHGLTGLGHDVEVVALAGKDGAKSNATIVTDGITVHRAEPIKITDARGLVNFCLPVSRPMMEELSGLWNAFWQVHKEKPFDIAEAPEHFAEGAFVAVSKPLPLVVRLHTPHSKLLNERFHNFSPSFDHQFLSMLERFVMLSADQLVSPSEDLAAYVANDLGYELEKISIIRNPVDINHFCPDGRRALSFDGRPIVLFVGRLEERKGIQYLIDAIPQVLAKCKNAQFVIIGSDTMTGKGNQSVLAELKQSLAAHGVTDAVTFVPQVPLSEMPDYYRSADILVLPSLYDNAPCTVIEAMSCGKAIVGTTAGGTKEYATHDQCGLIVPPRDTAALAAALTTLLENESRRSKMGDNARRRAVDNFSRDETSRRTVDLYGTVSERWRSSDKTALYRKDPSELLDHFNGILNACEKTLYNLMFVESVEFRFQHWLKKAKQSPGQTLARILAQASKSK